MDTDILLTVFIELDKKIIGAKIIGALLTCGWPKHIITYNKNAILNDYIQKFIGKEITKLDFFNNFSEIFIDPVEMASLLLHVLNEVPILYSLKSPHGNLRAEYEYSLQEILNEIEKLNYLKEEKEILYTQYVIKFNQDILKTLKIEADIS
jgi:hypothetical protein